MVCNGNNNEPTEACIREINESKPHIYELNESSKESYNTTI